MNRKIQELNTTGLALYEKIEPYMLKMEKYKVFILPVWKNYECDKCNISDKLRVLSFVLSIILQSYVNKIVCRMR